MLMRSAIYMGAFGLLCAGALPSPSSADVPLVEPFNISDVGFEEDCTPNKAFGRLLSLIRVDENPDLGVYNAVTASASGEIIFDTNVPWKALHLRGIRLYHGIERGPVNHIMIFDDPAETVREVWNKLGWKLPAVDESREIAGLEGYAYIGVSRAGDNKDMAEVTCWRD